MVLRIVAAVLIGGGVGLAVGLTSSRLGGQCPLMCNPYVSTDYRRLVEQTEGVLLVQFYKKNCPACRRQSPAIVALSDRFAGRAKVAAVNASPLHDTAVAEGVRGVPTTLIFRGGERVETLVGLTGEQELAGLIEKHLAPGGPPAEETAGEDGQ